MVPYKCICYICGQEWNSTRPDNGDFLCIDCTVDQMEWVTEEEFNQLCGLPKKENRGNRDD